MIPSPAPVAPSPSPGNLPPCNTGAAGTPVLQGCFGEPRNCLTNQGGDTGSQRPFVIGDIYSRGSMTVEKCLGICKVKGMKYAGLQWAGECYCGSDLTAYLGVAGTCNMACMGNGAQLCGGHCSNSIYVASETVVTGPCQSPALAPTPPGPLAGVGQPCAGQNGIYCQSGLCCSQWGYCGADTQYCNNMCQTKFSAASGACAGRSKFGRGHG